MTTILAKLGVEGGSIDAGNGNSVRVVVLFAWAMVFGLMEQRVIPELSRRTLPYLGLSGLTTGVSWLATSGASIDAARRTGRPTPHRRRRATPGQQSRPRRLHVRRRRRSLPQSARLAARSRRGTRAARRDPRDC